MIPSIQKIQKEYGTRPFFIYDLDGMKSHLDQFKIPGVRFWYATKANPLSSVLKTAFDAGFGIDCASSGEYRQALRNGIPTEKILLTGPCKTKTFLTDAIHAGLKTFVLESIQQAKDLEEVCKEANTKVSALLRLQIKWQDGEKSVLGGSKVTPFGLDHEGWQELKAIRLENIQLKGVHCFQWGNVLDMERMSKIWTQTAKEAKALAESIGFKLDVLDVGGGLGIPYHDEAPIPYSAVEEKLEKLKTEVVGTEIWMELGRYAVGAFGKYASLIIDRKTVQDKKFLVIEGGVHHLVRPALIGDPFPVTLMSKEDINEFPLQEFEVHGPLCTSLDHLGKYSLPLDLSPGDTLIFHQCGAYGFTESMPFFLCHDLPAEFVVQEGQIRCVRTWQSPEGWLV